MFGELVVSRIGGGGGFAETAARVLDSKRLYRAALSITAVGAPALLVLAHAPCVALEPVDRRLAQLALWARLGEAIVVGAVLVFRIAALRLRAAAGPAGPFRDDQIEALVALTGRAYGSGVRSRLICFSPGFTLFSCLFFESRPSRGRRPASASSRPSWCSS